MTPRETAKKLASKYSFYVFPLIEGKKIPAVSFKTLATRDEKKIDALFYDDVLGFEHSFNVGIFTEKFGENLSLIVVDIDNKNKKKGDESVFELELEGFIFPKTLTQVTKHGRHLIYKVSSPVKQGAGVLGQGIDIRSSGGYVVSAGSVVDGFTYKFENKNTVIANAPEWVIKKCGKPGKERKVKINFDSEFFTSDKTRERAIEYLENNASLAIEGDGGDETTFKVASRLKDIGVSEGTCIEIMLNSWNDRCSPPWQSMDLQEKIYNAYKYGQNKIGVDSPQNEFSKLTEEDEDDTDTPPVEKVNKEFAFVIAGGGAHILWETHGPKDNKILEHLDITAFHQMMAPKILCLDNNKTIPISKLWITDPKRRSYDGICFMPGRKNPERFYNLWQGFAYEPLCGDDVSSLAHDALEQFKEHALQNVCKDDKILFNWLMSYFAHMIQKPWELPLVALVFRGGKGVGKNALINCVGNLLGNHYLLTSNRRYLVGQFNGHMENLILFALDEAFWSGDKQSEGILKNLISGNHHNIEHKGKEIFKVDNCIRTVILGNEDWVIPASHDERRFAVFDVGDKRKQDIAYFTQLEKGMEAGGYGLLLDFLQNFKIKVSIKKAPLTEALLDQKLESLGLVHQWWYSCLQSGEISGSDFNDGEWILEVEKDRIKDAFKRYIRDRQIRTWAPSDRTFLRQLKACSPSILDIRKRQEGARCRFYKFPDLEKARGEWSKFVGQDTVWS